jgi:uncharacterized protein (DUF433 family)
MASRVVSLRLKEREAATLQRQARLMQRTVGETAARYLTEALRMVEFPGIEFRQTSIGRLAYVKGTRVAVWMLVMIARSYAMDVAKVAEHLEWRPEQVRGGLDYAAAFPEEVDPLVEETETMTYEKLKQRLPGLQLFQVS